MFFCFYRTQFPSAIELMENRYYGLPDDILMKILLLVRDALHEELMINRNSLWVYKGRIAFVAAREATSEYDSDSDSEYDPKQHLL